ncbi:hypothetical protein MMC18_001291 [Xylographa bjoerkii]|nr:hypothetical protein [Xylographa bjoerkii]
MATWRDQKFVPDSDDEDEGLDIDEIESLKRPDGQDSAKNNSRDRQQQLAISEGHDEGGPRYFHGSVNTSPSGASLADRASSKPGVDGHINNLERYTESKCISKVVVNAQAWNDEDDVDELQLASSDRQPAAQRSRPPKTPIRLPNFRAYDDVGQDELQQDVERSFSSSLPGPQLTSELLRQVSHKNLFGDTVDRSDQMYAVDSTTSSPLSESSSTALAIGFSQRDDNFTVGPAVTSLFNTKHSLCLAEDSSTELEQGNKSSTNTNTVPTGRPARAMRQRNPIQLHPYLLEGEQYRKALQARGIKPLRIDQQAVAANDTGEVVSQAQMSRPNEEDEAMSSDFEHATISSPLLQRTPIVEASQPLHQLSQEDEDEFPDVRSLLRQPSNAIAEGHKRRKVTFSRKGKAPRKQEDASLNVIIDSSLRPDPAMRSASALFDVPPSPPLSVASAASKQTVTRNEPFRFPPGTTPAQVPTPLNSSDIRNPPAIDIHYEAESDKANERTLRNLDPGNRATTIVSSSEESESESESDHQLQRVQRKIRGVLPASWLRLDLKTQGKKVVATTAITRDSASPTNQFPRQGVARPILSHKNQIGNSPRKLQMDISNDSLSDHDSLSVLETSYPQGAVESFIDDTPVLLGDSVEGMEDNRIDWMLPPKSRKTSSTKMQKTPRSGAENGRNHQRHNKDTRLFKKRADNTGRQPKISEHIVRTSKDPRTQPARFRPPRRSILDVTHIAALGPVPNFVRVAVRTTKSRKDRGRHSPSRKFLRLATREDTADVQNTLQEWQEDLQPVRSQNIPRGHDKTRLTRPPLNPRSGNRRIRSATYYLSEEEGDENTYPMATYPIQLHAKEPQNILDRLLSQVPESRRRLHTASKAIARSNGPQNMISELRKGQLSSFVNSSTRSRPAMLETFRKLESASRRRRPQHTRFSRHMTSSTNEDPSRLEAFLESSVPSIGQVRSTTEWSHDLQSPYFQRDSRDDRPQSRKTCPKQIDIGAPPYRQDNIPALSPVDVVEVRDQIGITLSDTQTLQGLGPFGTNYAITFGIEPLLLGQHFHRNTFVGSGEFSEALRFKTARDLDLPTHPLSTIRLSEISFEWGAWNDTVSSQLGIVYKWLNQHLQMYQNEDDSTQHSELQIDAIISVQRSVVRYITNDLYFLDCIDRLSFLQRFQGLIEVLLYDLQNFDPTNVRLLPSAHGSYQLYHRLHIQISMLNLVIIYQLQLISVHESIPQSLGSELGSTMTVMAEQAIALSISSGLGKIREFLHASAGNAWTLVDVSQLCEVESVIIAHHVIRQQPNKTGAVWKIINDCIGSSGSRTMCHAGVLDEKWHQLLSLVPLMEINTKGEIEKDRRFKEPLDNWSLVRDLVRPVLDSYRVGPDAQGPTFNSYFRAVLSRCFMLINQWGWSRCESIILAFFDFFAAINLGHLRNETSHGSPAFLEHLSNNIKLEIASEDRCFHIFVKILGTGLRQMHRIYPDKKIRDIVFRMMPNHDRRHPREEAISQDDLVALRNHHDLICVLYWASPSGFRPRLSAIQNLIQLENSHKEACHISIRAWSNLVNYQVSTEEPVSILEGFSEWYNDILAQVLRQHSFARLEVESQVKISECTGGCVISRELQESTISKNQRHIEALLSHALISLRRAINSTRGTDAAEKLLSTSIAQVFELFNIKQPRIDNVIIQALEVIVTFAKRVKSKDAIEDSQDYGDLSAFGGELAGFIPARRSTLVNESIYTSLHCLLSNCFGADSVPEDSLLVKLVQAWSCVAQLSVQSGRNVWTNYIGLYGSESWASLGDTEQKRKFSAAFLATLMEEDQDFYRSHAQLIIKQWMGALVERESLLKFQHQLTTNILNSDRDNPLIANLPFWVDPKTGLFNIAAAELRERRLSLLSCIFSNIRESSDFSTYHNLPEKMTQRNEYVELLKNLMATMKHNYQELGNGSNVRGAYVDFIHTVVESLQQHCTDICPVDRFFTSPGAFPLPAKDPTYVVGRLRNYATRLHDPKTAKQLSSFIQPIFETAATDGQQQYLVEQLTTAMSHNFEKGDTSKPTLRMFVVQTILPAYTQLALRNPCMSLLVIPLLQALEKVLENLIKDLDGFNTGSIMAMQNTVLSVFACLRKSSDDVLSHPRSLTEPLSIRAVGFYFSMIRAMLPTLDYINRLKSQRKLPHHYLHYFTELAQYVTSTIFGQEPIFPIQTDNNITLITDERVKAACAFTLTELQNSLQTKWSIHNGQFYFTKNRTASLVQIDIGSLEEEKSSLLRRAQEFQNELQNMAWLSDGEAPVTRIGNPLGLDNLVF